MRAEFLALILLVAGCMQAGPDCDDDNPCTQDALINGTCVQSPLNGPVEGCYGQGGCMEYQCQMGDCMPSRLADCCGNGACELNEGHTTCPADCQATCYDGLVNQGESGTDCGGPCKSCDAENEIYIERISKLHTRWSMSLTNYTQAINEYNDDANRSALSAASMRSYGETDVIRGILVRTEAPENLSKTRDMFKRSMDIYLRSLDAMVRYMKSMDPGDRTEANRLLADSTENNAQFVTVFNSLIIDINQQRARCANYKWDEGEESIDCGGFCPTDCMLSFNVTKRVRISSKGDTSDLTLNISAPAIDYEPHQSVHATYTSPDPVSRHVTDEGNIFYAFRFPMPGYSTKDITITQTVTLKRARPPAKAAHDHFSMEYLSPSNMSPRNDDICFRAEVLTDGADGTHDKALRLVSWLTKNIEYEANQEDAGAEYCFYNRKGACDEHADLFISLARCIGVPARRVTGSLYNDSKLSGHAWAEFYDNGWVYIDPSIKKTERTVAPDSRHLIACVGDNAYSCGVGYTYKYTGERPELDIEEKIYIS